MFDPDIFPNLWTMIAMGQSTFPIVVGWETKPQKRHIPDWMVSICRKINRNNLALFGALITTSIGM
jgi:hypothetical protein